MGRGKRTPEQRARIAAATKAAMARPEVRARFEAAMRDPEVREKISASKRGEKNPMYGRKASAETRQKMSEAIKARGRQHDGNPAWKGDDAKAAAMHVWLRRYYPYTGVCEECGETKRTEYAFQRWPEPYTRNREDYRELCRRCHSLFDRSTGERS